MADTTYTTQVGFAPELAPYGQQLLGNAQNLTTQTPYQSYQQWAQAQGLSGDQTAQFSGLQKQAFQGAQNLGQNQYSLDAAGGMQSLLGNSWNNPGTAEQFMSPYMQGVVENQQRDAQRQADIATTARNAQATGAGAFGGSRQAIMDAEANRNLALQKGDIEAAGLQNAYSQGQQQYNAQQQQGLAGLANLGSMGQNLYGQTTGNLNLQDQMGTQQQQQAQNMINTNVQNYTNQLNYPYKQLGFMSDIIRGSPMSNQGSSVYQAPPSQLSQVAGLGLTAAGLMGKGAKRGGAVSSRKPAGLPGLLISRMA